MVYGKPCRIWQIIFKFIPRSLMKIDIYIQKFDGKKKVNPLATALLILVQSRGIGSQYFAPIPNDVLAKSAVPHTFFNMGQLMVRV